MFGLCYDNIVSEKIRFAFGWLEVKIPIHKKLLAEEQEEKIMRKTVETEELRCFLDNLTALRRKYGISKKKMAELLGVCVATINKIERGEFPSRVSCDVIFRAMEVFRIAPSKLFTKNLGE